MRRRLGKWTPTLVGLLFLYSGTFKLFYPGEATLALVALGFSLDLATAVIVAVTVAELYLGLVLLLKVDAKYALWLATAMILLFTVFLWYLSTLAHPPPCGCMGLTAVFRSNRANALLGLFRNCVVLWLLKCAYDYYFPPALLEGGKSP